MPNPEGPRGLQRGAKRALDATAAAGLLMLCSPLMLLVTVLVKLDSPGPVFIRQPRLGQNRRPFTLYKFRSMVANAESLRSDMLHLNEVDGPLFKIRNDPRRTRVGKQLRRFSMDELPQLWNVLRGDMSLVGPRPPLKDEVEADYLRQSRRLKFPPGMTGLWQVSGRSLLKYEDMIGLDLRYTRQWSIWLDLRILARTLPVVASGRGAY
jgi:lipopolysaccharide/colanic/teichoic acid biosynthesis glycosyltransferase